MDGRKFYRNVVAHEGLNWLGARTNNDGVDCAYVGSDVCKTEVPISEIANHAWGAWLALFLGLREAKVMRHVTRIVGYYSELQNWNPSKIAELDDRHKGEYVVPERKPAPVVREPELAIA